MTYKIKLTQSGLWFGNLSGKSGRNSEKINEYFWFWNGISDICVIKMFGCLN